MHGGQRSHRFRCMYIGFATKMKRMMGVSLRVRQWVVGTVRREADRSRNHRLSIRRGREGPGQRRRLVILGTGWGSYSVLRKADKKLFDVIVISPRNHFLFTPLLASTTVGTLEFRSIIEPVRNVGFRNEHHFHLSYASGLDVRRQVVQCTSSLDSSRVYEVPYDLLVVGVGADCNDYNIPGVREHAFFLKASN